jgi:predicted acylesterase/phospholipase RssA
MGDEMKITYVGSGAGALFYAHWGAAQCLYENKIFPKRFVGTSGGALAFAPLANGMIPKDCLNFAMEILPPKVMSWNWKMLMEDCWGLYSLNKLEKVLSKYTAKRFCDNKIPFYVVTTDLTTRQQRVFCQESTPLMSVPKAVRMSSSVPVLFDVVPFENSDYTDGGVVNNYAIDLKIDNVFDLTKEMAVGFRLLSKGTPSNKKPTNLFEFLVATLDCAMCEIERKHVEDAASWSKTININVPWRAMDFMNVTQEVIERIYMSGYDAVKKKLENGWNPADILVVE